MTEEEARTKWCPFARVVTEREPKNPAFGPYNRLALNGEDPDDQMWMQDPEIHCIASDCMAWRTNAAGYAYCGLVGAPK